VINLQTAKALGGSGSARPDALFFSGRAGAMKLIAKGAINTGE